MYHADIWLNGEDTADNDKLELDERVEHHYFPEYPSGDRQRDEH
jgi:hypothetical protein